MIFNHLFFYKLLHSSIKEYENSDCNNAFCVFNLLCGNFWIAEVKVDFVIF